MKLSWKWILVIIVVAILLGVFLNSLLGMIIGSVGVSQLIPDDPDRYIPPKPVQTKVQQIEHQITKKHASRVAENRRLKKKRYNQLRKDPKRTVEALERILRDIDDSKDN